jgi:flagellar motility protein MotE (MotC chaperone)
MRIRLLSFVIFCSIISLITKIGGIIGKHREIFITESNASSASSSSESQSKKESATPAKPPKEGDNTKLEVTTTKPTEYKSCAENNFSDIELDLLKNLSKRRQELEEWGQSMATKEATLKAAEVKLEKKLNDLKKFKTQVDEALVAYNQQEDARITNLVKIYENMKPKDAAKIFDGLDVPVLLQVIGKMKEAKTAPILAQMSADIATMITELYAHPKKITAAQ